MAMQKDREETRKEANGTDRDSAEVLLLLLFPLYSI